MWGAENRGGAVLAAKGADRECGEPKMWGAAQELAGKGVPGWRWDVTVPELWGRYGSFFVHSLVLKMLTEPGGGGRKGSTSLNLVI